MKSKVEQCRVVVRQLGREAGIEETNLEVASLEQLFESCVGLADRHLLERLVVSGRDGQGRRRTLTFTFQSVSNRE
jgi:hypothetical protein